MKTIPIALQGHLDEDATTWCFITRVETKGGQVFGFADLDAPVVYDDGNGEITYQSRNGGFTPERLQFAADLTVDNTDLLGWVNDQGITEADIRAGLFDYARVRVYRVNYLDLSQGHEIMATGTCGETKFSQNSWRTEFRSLTQQLKQPISNMYSLQCAVKFGSPRCGKPFVWVTGEVSAVDIVEPDRIFSDDSADEPEDWYIPGVVEWLTGDNTGAQMDIDVYGGTSSGGDFELTLPMPYAIQVGDTYRRRQDCNKVAITKGDVQGDCKDKHNNLMNFRGQHLIPLADAGSSMVPGSEIETE